jgi:signal transduction histidine kinase/ActR/RegA family two-component response regulator
VIDRGLVIREPSGAARRMVGSMSDITARIGMEAQLREAQKLEAVGQLTGGVAHDFNNLLTVIIGTAESLLERLEHDAESVMLAEMTTAAAQRGAELTSRLLAFARQQPLEPKATNIGRLVADFDPILRRTLSEDIDLEVVRGGGLWAAMVDPGQLETALLNLAINARDAMPAGGRLTIETGNVSLDEEYARMNEEVTPGQYVMVSVSDTGTGMPRDVVSRAFEPFFTTKDVGKGSGLGLSMVYGFAKQSRGHVKIYSETGEGTTVRLYLPRAHANQAAAESGPAPSANLASGSERILVVEDDPMVREHVARQLRSLGYHVTEAADGPQALHRLREGERFDLLFTDVVMPGGMNGRELAVAATAVCQDLKVLFTSGYSENAIVHHGRLDPGVQLLSKPYRKRDLADRVRKVLDGQAGGNRQAM